LSPEPRYVDQLIRGLIPVTTRRAILDLFEHKAPWETIRTWRKGHRAAPHWAIDMLERKARDRADQLQLLVAGARQQKEKRPGLKAGALNLAKWRARR
jgi:hypothetical protein